MRWLIGQLTDRDSGWWYIYELVSPFLAWLFLGVLFGDLTGLILHSFEIVLDNTSHYKTVQSVIVAFRPVGTVLLILIIFLDAIKFKLTGDPRDQPGRKWWSVKHAHRFLPNEVIIMPGNHIVTVSDAVNLQIAAMPVTNCSKCDVTHAFGTDEAAPRTCVLYGCGKTVRRPEQSITGEEKMTTMKNHLHRKLRCSIAGRILIEKVGDIGGFEEWREAELNATHLELIRSEEGTKSFKTAFQNFLANLKS